MVVTNGIIHLVHKLITKGPIAKVGDFLLSENGPRGEDGVHPYPHHGVASPVQLEIGSMFILIYEVQFIVFFVKDGGKTDIASFNVRS